MYLLNFKVVIIVTFFNVFEVVDETCIAHFIFNLIKKLTTLLGDMVQ